MPKRRKASKPKVKINPFEKKVLELDARVPFRTCLVCEREGRDLQLVRLGKYRCPECKPGSGNWLDWYELLPKDSPERTSIGDNIYKYGRKL